MFQNNSELTELLSTRRSIRKYSSTPVEQEKINQILTAALMSPTSKRSNSWEFIVVTDKQMLSNLALCRQNGSQFLENSPCGIVVLADTSKSDVWVEDASIASIIIQLQAHNLGLGSCWIQVRNRQMNENTSSEDYIKQILDIPSNFNVLNIISIGYPEEMRKPHDLEKLNTEKIHFEKF